MTAATTPALFHTKDAIEAERVGRRLGFWGSPQFSDRFVCGSDFQAVAVAVFPSPVHSKRYPRGMRNTLSVEVDASDY